MNLFEKDKRQNAKPFPFLVATQLCTDNQVQKLEDYAACACAIQNLSLSLVADDVGCKWSTGQITKDPNTYKLHK